MPDMSDPSPPVLVVGAGPTGLLLAAELERRDVPCLLIDALDAPRGWDRATVVHARSLEIFEALGLEDRLLADGVRTRAARFQSDGDVLGELNFGASGSRYGFDIGLSEEVTESVLTDFLEAHGGRVTRSTRLTGLVAGELNAICPGPVRSPMSDQEGDASVELTPVRRRAEPEEISSAIAFLASGDAIYITGAELVIDGGYLAR
jgi:2-polyprenyl-6-methoxyphenol hydroxylase-like FAD-dependent oxidoreductase